MTFSFRARWLSLPLMVVALGLHASSAAIDNDRSELVAVFKQMGVAVEGRFTAFSGTVAFDPADPADAEAELQVQTASFDLGLPDYNAEVRKAEWFDSEAHPQAVFRAQGLTPLGDGRYRADGSLSLKGQSRPLGADITIREADGHRLFEGELVLDRTDYGIGDPGWSGVVDDEVRIRFRIAQALP
jgi:polyisoprenoid-binding protein YceI